MSSSRAKSFHAFTVLAFLVLFAQRCQAQEEAGAASSPTTRWLVPRTNITGPEANDYECESARAADYYGLGVRLGIYFGWFTGWIANSFVPDEVGAALDTNAIFLFANLVAMVRCTITYVVTQLDCVILMHLSGGTVFSVLSLWGYRTCQYKQEGPQAVRHFGGFGTHLRLLLSLGVSIYGLWFWLLGIRSDTTEVRIDTGPCATVYTFMFSKVRAEGGVRIFYVVVCVSCIIYFGAMLLASVLALYARGAKMVQLARRGLWRTSTRLHYATGFQHKELRRIFSFLRIGNFLFIVYSMILVETTLNYNHVKGVLGPGGRLFFPSQLIPLIIGCFSFVRLVYKVLEKRRDPDESPSLPTKPHTKDLGTGPQEFPGVTRVFKIFAPPTSAVTPPPSAQYFPEDTDIDEVVEGTSRKLRYLVAWLPWLSLFSWWKKDNNDQEKQRGQARPHEKRRRRDSQSSTLQGSPTNPTFNNPYSSRLPD